ncbi:MAG: hypothetical protein ACREYE_05370 [Gammaproteobacteria bacterium]
MKKPTALGISRSGGARKPHVFQYTLRFLRSGGTRPSFARDGFFTNSQSLPMHRIPATDIGNGPAQDMKAHQQQRLLHLRYRCAHVGHNQRWRHGKNVLTTLRRIRRQSRCCLRDGSVNPSKDL